MFPVIVHRNHEASVKINRFYPESAARMPKSVAPQADTLLDKILSDLSLESSWGDRRLAARQLGYLGNPAAVSGLVTALPADPFWMVRTVMIQALEMIGDPRAIPTLQRVEKEDSFLTVRSHAAKAIETLSGIEG